MGGGGNRLCLGTAKSNAGGRGIVTSEDGATGSFKNSAICLRIVELRGPLSCWTAENKTTTLTSTTTLFITILFTTKIKKTEA